MPVILRHSSHSGVRICDRHPTHFEYGHCPPTAVTKDCSSLTPEAVENSPGNPSSWDGAFIIDEKLAGLGVPQPRRLVQ
jgi:hypothetical protein